MKLEVRHETLAQIGFAAAFNFIFFLPYLGQTHFRVDQFLGVFAIAWLVLRAFSSHPMPASPEVTGLFKWSFVLLVWAAVLCLVTPGRLIDTLQLVNSFSNLAGGVALYVLTRDSLKRDLRIFLLVSLIFSIAINLLGLHLWLVEDSPFVRGFLDFYGGAHDESYGEAGSIGGVSQLGGRVASVFPHSQAYAVYNLLIMVIGSYAIYIVRGWWGRAICVLAVLMSLVGGVLSSAKTYTFCLLIALLVDALISLPQFLRRPRLNLFYASVMSFLLFVSLGFYQYNRFLRDQINALLDFDVNGVLASRVGEDGYLVKSGTVAAMLKPVALAVGMGGGVSDYAWSDNGYFQILMFGGIPFFLFFYGYLVYLTVLLRRGATRASGLYVGLYVALFVGNTGTLLFLFPRAGLLLSFFSIVALEHRSLTSAIGAFHDPRAILRPRE